MIFAFFSPPVSAQQADNAGPQTSHGAAPYLCYYCGLGGIVGIGVLALMLITYSWRPLDNKHFDRILLQYLLLIEITYLHCLYMAKFFAELLGCTLRDKGASPTFEVSAKDEGAVRLLACVRCVCLEGWDAALLDCSPCMLFALYPQRDAADNFHSFNV